MAAALTKPVAFCKKAPQRASLRNFSLPFLKQETACHGGFIFRSFHKNIARPMLASDISTCEVHSCLRNYEVKMEEQKLDASAAFADRGGEAVKAHNNAEKARARPFSSISESPSGSPCSSSGSPVVAVGMSGGVDSSVAALMLQRQGYAVFGMFMRNWDSLDEAGNATCSMDQDFKDAQRVCRHLGIKLFEVDYQRRYWTDVFEAFTRDCAAGLTTNPDLACNKYIKKDRLVLTCVQFDALLESAKKLGASKLATGHYARLLHPSHGKHIQLLRAADHGKDQSYFLASVPGRALNEVIFPVGSFQKSEIRKIALSEGLVTANKRSSAGICFVGRRKFSDFISEYVELIPGPFISVEDGSTIGTHDGVAAYTHGQRARIGGKAEAFYVVGKDIANNAVFVADGADHPALFCTSAVADSLSWIAGEPPWLLGEGKTLKCFYKARYRQSPEECTVCLTSASANDALREGLGVAGTNSEEFKPSSFCRLRELPPWPQQLQVRFVTPARAITPGQALVLYVGDTCLGSARLLHPGPTIFEQNSRIGVRKLCRCFPA